MIELECILNEIENMLLEDGYNASDRVIQTLNKAQQQVKLFAIPDVSVNEERVAVGCHTCKHNPHAPFIPEICYKCNPQTLSEWQQTYC